MHPVGTRVSLARPSMWAGELGVVEVVSGRMHIVRITQADGNKFPVAAPFEELKVDNTSAPNPPVASQPSSKE